MFNLGKFLKKINTDTNYKSNNILKYADSIDVATAEYSFFYIHQVKPCDTWVVNQEGIDYTVDTPLYLG